MQSSALQAMGFAGLNLTIPLKEKALELDILQPDELARAIGAVNTISFGMTAKKIQENISWATIRMDGAQYRP